MHYLYVLYNLNSRAKRKWYIGITSDLRKRIAQHHNKQSTWTSKFGPWQLVYYEAYLSQSDAELREKRLKHHGKGVLELKKRLVKSINKTKKVRD